MNKKNITKDQLFANYKQQKNEITKLIRQSKNIYYNEYFSKNNTNIKKLWIGVNQILNKPKSSTSSPVCIEIDVDGNVSTIVAPEKIANAFNDHYTSVAGKILDKRKYAGKQPFHTYLKNPSPLTFFIKPTTTS